MSNTSKSQEMSGMPANMKFVPAGNIFAPSPDPRDAEIAKLREALVAARDALNQSGLYNERVDKAACIIAQALAEPGGEP